MMYLWLLVGFVLLIKGADFFVEGSSAAARLLRIPSVVIGLTIVAMGTSAPEAAVSISAGLAGKNEIALSNVIGSNIFNLLVVVGACACIRAFPVDKTIVKRDFPVCICATIVLLVMMTDGILQRWEGVLLLVMMVVYLAYTVMQALRNRESVQENEMKRLSPFRSALYMVGGIAAVIWGGDMVVDSASAIASSWGLSQTLIGLTIVAVGTSLPELVTSIAAAHKGDSGLAIGNVIGSNIFNILFILGMSSGLSAIPVSQDAIVDIAVLGGFTLAVFIICKAKGKMSWRSGALAIPAYLLFSAYIILR